MDLEGFVKASVLVRKKCYVFAERCGADEGQMWLSEAVQITVTCDQERIEIS
jgi:hypothetical protein